MEKIFVAITSLDDQETVPTVIDALRKAHDPQRVVVGIAVASSNKKIFGKLKKLQREFPGSIRLSYDRVTKKNQIDLFGVGRGRLRARALYQDEDYFLQIDSHSMFDKNWDKDLILLHKEAKESLKLNKVIITAYAGKYSVDKDGTREILDDDTIPGESKRGGFLYNTFYDDHPRYDIVPSWVVNNSELARSKTDKFIPSLKFNANFSFGDKEFAYNLSISENEIFFEEELIQTIKLMGLGFAMVHPNVESAVIRHLYADYGTNEEIIKSYGRKNLATEFDRVSLGYQKSLAMKNYLSFISDKANKEKIDSYQRYAGVNLFSCKSTRKDPIPKTWKLDIFGEYPYNSLEDKS
jgi:hypothetical protein